MWGVGMMCRCWVRGKSSSVGYEYGVRGVGVGHRHWASAIKGSEVQDSIRAETLTIIPSRPL